MHLHIWWCCYDSYYIYYDNIIVPLPSQHYANLYVISPQNSKMSIWKVKLTPLQQLISIWCSHSWHNYHITFNGILTWPQLNYMVTMPINQHNYDYNSKNHINQTVKMLSASGTTTCHDLPSLSHRKTDCYNITTVLI